MLGTKVPSPLEILGVEGSFYSFMAGSLFRQPCAPDQGKGLHGGLSYCGETQAIFQWPGHQALPYQSSAQVVTETQLD